MRASAITLSLLLWLSSADGRAEDSSTVPAKQWSPLRVEVDAHTGVTYHVASERQQVDRAGAVLGGSMLLGPRAGAWAAGFGYERSLLGLVPSDSAGYVWSFGRNLDAFWTLGQIYAYQTDGGSIYGVLGIAPVWVSTVETEVNSNVPSCPDRLTTGLGMRLGAGAQLSIAKHLSFVTSIGVDYLGISNGGIYGCGPDVGSDGFVAARFGLVLTTGRRESPGERRLAARAPSGLRSGTKSSAPRPAVQKKAPPPPPDQDEDGIRDGADACLTEPGQQDPDPLKHGCPLPPDRDGDGVPDTEDACPALLGTPGAPEDFGCPSDADGDGIRDDQDACPEEKGSAKADESHQGCPLVKVTTREIIIAHQIQFEIGRVSNSAVTHHLLNEIARMILQHPEILLVEVQGHTDNTGTLAKNTELSQQRAEAVQQALIERGVEPARLNAKGYGADQPIARNAAEAGRAKNRRVQFKILKRQ